MALNASAFDLQVEQNCPPLSSLKLILPDTSELYVKVMRQLADPPDSVHVYVTYMPEEAQAFMAKLLAENAIS